jgi:hypothetical protein
MTLKRFDVEWKGQRYKLNAFTGDNGIQIGGDEIWVSPHDLPPEIRAYVQWIAVTYFRDFPLEPFPVIELEKWARRAQETNVLAKEVAALSGDCAPPEWRWPS